MYYKGATTTKEILKTILGELPLAIVLIVIIYFTFQELWDFIFDLIVGKVIIIRT